MRRIAVSGIVATALLLAFCVTACKSMESYTADRAERSVLDTKKARNMELLDGRVYNLEQCISYALKHNLQVRLHELDVKIAKENKMAEVMGMLPELNFNENFSARSNTPASRSEKIHEDGETYGNSTSEERQVNYFNIDLVFSVLDMGLSYWNTEIAHNKMLLHKQRAARMSQNIQLDVVKAYFKVAAAQRAKNKTEKLLAETRKKADDIRKLSLTGKMDPIMAFNVLRKFTAMEKQLTNYVRVYENACTELRTLMGLYPSPMINVDESCLDNLKALELFSALDRMEKTVGADGTEYLHRDGAVWRDDSALPDVRFTPVELMEQIALLQRPEMYESDLQQMINVIECRKVILMMFPNVKLYTEWANSSNKYLYHQSWLELGVRAAYNLLLLPHHIAKYTAYSKQTEVSAMRRYAKSVAVMAQVRLGHANLLSAQEIYKKDVQISRDYKLHLANATKVLKSGAGKYKGMDLEYMRLETLKAEIDSILSLGNCYVAYYRLLNAMGINSADYRTLDSLWEELSDTARKAASSMKKARQEYKAERVEQFRQELEKQAAAERKQAEEADRALREKINREIDAKLGKRK